MNDSSSVLLLALGFCTTGFSQDVIRRAPTIDPFTLSIQPTQRQVPLPQYFTTFQIANLDSVNSSVPDKILWKPYDPATVGVQTLIAAGSVAIIGGIVALVGKQHDPYSGMIVAAGGAVVAAISFPTGFYFGGKWMGGNGSYMITLLGGLGVGGIALLTTANGHLPDATLIIITSVAMECGSLFGYHLSSSTRYDSQEESSSMLGGESTDAARSNLSFPGPYPDNVRILTLSFHI